MSNDLYISAYNPDVLSCIANLSNDEVFTPPEAANAMLDLLPQELFRDPDTTFLDPACKSGVFLREIAKRLLIGLEPATFNIFKWIFKTFVATYLLTNCFTIVMAVFDVAQNVVSQSAGVINGNLDVTAALADLETQLEAMGMWELIGLWLETNIINLCMWVLSIVIFVIVYGRMIEIYLTVSLAPIPFSTMANREWGQMGTNYLRSLFALGFQGFLILVCVAIYAVLVQSIPSSGDIHGAIWGTAGYTVLLAFALFKTGSLSKSIFNSH